MLEPGARLGRYEIRSQLGAGGMGEVYLALDTRLARQVALKVLPAAVATDPARMGRFEQEARSASGLNHPNIITIHEIDRSDATTFIAMEFIDGATLRQRMRGQPMPTGEVVQIALQIASALAAAHASGIVHRDIKPENVIVRGDGIVKVLDFGLAKSTGDEALDADGEAPTYAGVNTDTGVVMGTATYMSPEQARGQLVDARTDVFSLGIVVYEMLSGRRPFEGPSPIEIMAAIVSDREAPPLSGVAPGVATEFERIVAKMLRKSRDERYQTAKDLVVDLQALKRGLESGSAPAVRSRRSRAIAVAAGVLVVVGAALGFAWWKQDHALVEPALTSLAVLPLKPLDAGDNYLGLGIADAAIRRVSQTGQVIVRPTSAVRRYLTEDTDALTAARQLGVDSVLEGSFQRVDERLRVSVNLLRCRDGVSLWSDSFDIPMADIFVVQDTVAQQVASRLRLQLDRSQQAQLTKRYTSNPVAYDFYLKAAYNFDQRMRDPRRMMDTAIGFYKQAIDADPGFALAHAQLAYAYATIGTFLDPTQPAWMQSAQAEIDRAQALDPQLAETHLARFQLLYSEFGGYQAEAAAREALEANRLNPNVGHWELAYMFNHLGLEELAARETARGLEIDPTSDALRQNKLLMYEVQSRLDDYAADPAVGRDGRVQALYLMGKGRFDEAQKVVDALTAAPSAGANVVSTQALLRAARGDFGGAEADIPKVLARHPRKDPIYHHAAYDIACIYALEGKSADAVKWLRESATWGYHLYPRYTRDPYLNRIRQSPEFVQFLAEMKIEHDTYQREFSGLR